MGLDLSVLILCAGDQTRWSRDDSKQLVLISGEPLLLRTIRQVRRHNIEPYAITHRQDIISALIQTGGVPCYNMGYPKSDRCIVQTVLTTAPYWRPRTIILLGDVVYSDELMDQIMTDLTVVRFYGRSSDLLSLSFLKGYHTLVERHAQIALGHHLTRGGRGKLWELYRSICGFDLNVHQIEGGVFRPVKDWSRDFDTIEQYTNFLERHPWSRES